MPHAAVFMSEALLAYQSPVVSDLGKCVPVYRSWLSLPWQQPIMTADV